MASKLEHYGNYGEGAASTTASLFSIAGGWGNVGGPGVFMLRSIVFGSASAVFFGMTSAILGSLAFGAGSLAFLVGSSLGFVLGTFRWYRHSLLQSLLVLDAYPALMRLHLHANFPLKRFNHLPLRDCRSDRFRGKWIMENMLVVAWLTAGPALDEMRANEERVLIETSSSSEPQHATVDGAKADNQH